MQKYHFLFSGQVWKMPLSHIAKNGPKTHFQLIFFQVGKKLRFFFSNKNHFDLVGREEKSQFYMKLSFWPSLGNMAQMHSSDLARKQKVIFYCINITSYQYIVQPILVDGKITCATTISNLFWNISIWCCCLNTKLKIGFTYSSKRNKKFFSACQVIHSLQSRSKKGCY